ncbi:MAG: DUF1800 domain-containing protein [Caldilineaceae bacterium]
MRLSRRDFIRMTGLVSSTLTLAGCASLHQRLASSPTLPPVLLAFDPSNFRALNRLTYGPRPEECLRVEEIGLAQWIEEQLAPAFIEDGDCEFRLRDFASLQLDAASIFDLYGDKLFDDQDHATAPNELRQATLLRKTYSRRQLYEVMVEFWSDHFNISVDKGDCFYLKTVDDREVIRPYALGNFGELLQASAHSPAMLVYLDNQANEKGHPNENYAREVMELHTLGVDGGYSQQDVMELARCLTGWGVKEHFWRGQFTFDPQVHDTGNKRVLGMEIAPGGQDEAERVIDRLAQHENTARFITRKIARRFLGDQPDADLIQRAALAFQRSKGDTGSVLRVLLLDGVAQLAQLPPKVKRPLNFVVSALRQSNANSDGGAVILDSLARMGQLPFAWPTPDGYPDHNADWLSNLLPRWQFALALVRNEIPGTTVDLPTLISPQQSTADELDRLALLLCGEALSPLIRTSLFDSVAAIQEPFSRLAVLCAGILASPTFQWR